MPDDDPSVSRRRVVATAGLAAASAGAAGCTSTLPPLGSRVRFGRVDAPAADPPAYRRWIPAPDALPGPADEEYGNTISTTPGRVGQDVLGEPLRFPGNWIKRQIDHFGVGYEHYDHALHFGETVVLEGDVDPAAVEETLAATRYRATDDYEGYALYDRGDPPRTAAVGGDAVLLAHGEDRRERLEAVVDAERGAVPRRHERDEAFRLCSDAVGARPFVYYQGDRAMELESTLHATATDFDEDGVYYSYTDVYPAGDRPSERDLRESAEEDRRARRADAAELAVGDRVVTLTMHESHATFAERRQRYGEGDVPQVTWRLDVSEDPKRLTVTHEGGDAVPGDALLVKYDRHHPNATLPMKDADQQFGDARVSRGDALTVDVGDIDGDETIALYHTGEHSMSAMAITSFDELREAGR